MKPVTTHLWMVSSIALGCLVTLTPATAQIVPDNTLPVNSIVTPGCTVCTINGGTVRGRNLFHSFSKFSVPTGGEAFFNNSLQIQNILTRVTGNSTSNIDGLIGTNGTANLFLLNPNGISFGANATLNLGGSFIGSTASSLVFADGTVFSAKPDTSTPPLLTINVPLGLQFGANPRRIIVQGNGDRALRVPSNQTLALVGGEIDLEGATLKTTGGRIELGSVAQNSLVTLTPTQNGFALGYGGVQNFGDIQLSQQAAVDASGAGGGDVQVMGRRITLTDGSQIEASTLGSQPGGSLVVNASESVELMGTSTDGQFSSGLFAAVYPGATGSGGDLTINTGTLLVRNGAQIGAVTFGPGNAGKLTVNASGDVQLIGISADGRLSSGLDTSAELGASGHGGDLTINTGTLLVQDGAQVGAGTFGKGNGGQLTVNASGGVQLIGTSVDGQSTSILSASAEPGSSGNGGDLTINTDTLLVRDGAQVAASTFGPGKSGKLTVNASDGVQLIGSTADGQSISILGASAEPGSSGNGGDLTINTGTLLVQDGAQILATTFGKGNAGKLTVNASSMQLIGSSANGQSPSGLGASTNPGSSGNGGDLTINTGTLLVQDGAQVSASTFGLGSAGKLTVNASDGVQLIGTTADGQHSSSLVASAYPGSSGNGGDLTINTTTLLVRGGAEVSAATLGQGNAGKLTVNASDGVQLIGISADGQSISGLGASATSSSSGNGGDLTINTPTLLVRDGAQVSAATFGPGNAGKLTVNASGSVELIGTSVDGRYASALGASAEPGASGNGGDLTINTGTLLVRDGAQIGVATNGRGKAGILTVNASDGVQLIGTTADGQFPTVLAASAESGSSGNGGDLTIKTGTLLVRDGAQVLATTFGKGNAGNLTVNASSVQLIGSSADGQFLSKLSASTEPGSSGNGGDLTIDTGTLLVRDGAQIGTATFGSGNAEKLTVNASGGVQLIGRSADNRFPSDLAASAEPGSSGNGGDLTINTPTLLVRDGARVSVQSSTGQAGNLTIQANSVRLNRGTLFALTAKSGPEGGANITLKGVDLLRMDNESRISANAGNQATGGNITIDSTFIVATPPTGSDGSDVTANATRGQGGAVNITTQGLYGIEFRPNLTPKNDITVTSESGVNGTFQLTRPFVEPTQSLTTLPTEIGDASRQIVQNCRAVRGQGAEENSFVITGRGGIPASPNEPLRHEEPIAPNWVTLNSEAENNTSSTPATPNSSTPKPMMEANGWIIDEKGKVELMATVPTITPHSPWQPPVNCRQVTQTEPPKSEFLLVPQPGKL